MTSAVAFGPDIWEVVKFLREIDEEIAQADEESRAAEAAWDAERRLLA